MEVSQDDGQTAVIAKGIAPGERVVTDGQSRLQEGVKVAVSTAPRRRQRAGSTGG